MKTLMTTTAIVAFAAMPALAQEQTAETGAFVTSGEEMQITADASASDLIGKRVYTSAAPVSEEDGVMEVSEEWEDIGEIGDILLSRDGSVEAVVLDVGGFLGIGEKHVALRMDQIQMINDADSEGEFFLVVNVDPETIEQAPEFDTANVAQWAGAVETAAENTGEAIEGAGEEVAQESSELAQETEQMAEGAAQETEQTLDAAGQEIAQESSELAQETEQLAEGAAQETEQTLDAAGQEIAEESSELAEDTEQLAEGAAQETEATLEETEQVVAQETSEAMEEADQMAESAEAEVEGEVTTEMAEAEANIEAETETELAEGAGTEEAEPATEAEVEMAETAEQPEGELVTTETEMASEGMAPSVEREGFTTASLDNLTTEDLEGARLYDINDELIGEVSSLIIDESGKITQAVLDVGGFLGIGEKSVALPMEELQIQTANEGGEVRVYVNATEEELEALEEYEEDS